IKLFGPDLDTLNTLAQQIATQVEAIPGAIDTFATLNEGAQYLQVSIDRIMAGRLGLDADALQTRLRAEIEGVNVGNVIEGSARVPLMLRYEAIEGDGLTRLSDSFIDLPDGGKIPLSEIATVARVEGPIIISRESGQRFSVIRTDVAERDLVGFVEEAQKLIADNVEMP
ncbi:efflux RND transporter permease subunit, partial [Methylophaga sp. UBA4204]